MRSTAIKSIIICVVVGCLGGAIGAAVGLASWLIGVVLGGGYGLAFALLASSRATTPGAGLLWGLAYAVLLWLTDPTGLFSVMMGAAERGMFDAARAQFPALVAYLLCFGIASAFPSFPIHFSFGLVLMSVFVSVMTGLVSGFAPAWSASRLDPVTALRYE